MNRSKVHFIFYFHFQTFLSDSLSWKWSSVKIPSLRAASFGELVAVATVDAKRVLTPDKLAKLLDNLVSPCTTAIVYILCNNELPTFLLAKIQKWK